MEVPGLSLFQGAESIKLNTEQQRIEEEDAIEDKKRRDEELKNELENAFDDLDDEFDDDEDVSVAYSTGNSSANHQHVAALSNPMFNGMQMNHKAHIDAHDTDRMEVLQLQKILSSKNEELRNVMAESTSERIKSQNKIDELNKRLAIAEAEKERAHMNRQQTHELFVESKQKLSDRDEQIADLNAKLKSYDNKNLDLLAELERTKTLLNEVQHKYHMVERNNSYSNDKDAAIKQLNDRHAAQTDMMQQQINTMRTKLEDQEREVKRMVIQNNELQKSREAILIDKADSVNQLTLRLDETQRQYQELVLKKNGASEDLAKENVRLMHSITELQSQADEMQRTINNLTMRLESTTTELEQLTETAIQDVDVGNNYQMNGIMETPMIRKAVSYPRMAVSSTPMPVEDRITRLKGEFNRCVADQKAKRQEVLALKSELDAKNRQIDQLKADENHALIELTTNKENADRLAIRLKNVERELEEYKHRFENAHEQSPKEDPELKNRLQILEQENNNLKVNCDHLNETIRALEDERDSTEAKYREACKDMAEVQQQLSQLQSGPCLECEKEKFITQDAKQECTRLKELYIQINEEKEDVMRKLRQAESVDLNKQLQEQKSLVATLERSLQLAEMKCKEISKILERTKVDHESQIQQLRTKHEEEIAHLEAKEQKDLSNSCRKCIDLTSKVAKLEIEHLQMQTACSGHLKDIHELKTQLKKADHSIVDLTEKLALKVEHDELLIELKGKAMQFEEFMRNQSPTKSALVNAIVSNQTSRVRDQCVSTEDLDSFESPRPGSANSVGLDRAAEKKIRSDMAKSMAASVRAIELEFKEQILDYEKQIEELSVQVASLRSTLRDRDTDISNLKKCILKERSEVKNIMEQRETEYSEAMKKQHSILLATRSDLEVANKQINTVVTELDQCRKSFQEERISQNKLLNEWKAELSRLAEREEKLVSQMKKAESTHKATIEILNEKISTAKKTAANYKKYSADKEKHIERESERIKLAYEAAVEKVKETMKVAMIDHEKQANKRIAELQAQLDALKKGDATIT